MAKVVFEYKHEENNGDIIEIHIFEVPKSQKQPEGVSYTLACIRNGERLVGYDNFEGHLFKGRSHHKHIGKRILPYEYVDYWKTIEDFYVDVERQGGLR